MTLETGDPVVVADRSHAGHHRTPGYLKGKRGTVARAHAAFANPETRAYGASGLPEQRLYLVEFSWNEVWGRQAAGDSRIYADIFEHWLEKAT